MAQYYLVSQLPSLDGIGEDKPLPITGERFLELCGRFLDNKAKEALNKLALLPPREIQITNSPLIDAWNNGERNLRNALGKIRAEKMGKSFDLENKVLPIELVKVANTATEIENPLKAEKYLNLYRLEFLETLRPMDNFSIDYIYYYALKLKLISYIRQFDTEIGEIAYKNIYNSIVDGDRLEDKQ